MSSIVLVGCGNMGFAMLKGWLAGNDGHRFLVVEPADALRERAADAGAETYASAEALPGDLSPDLVVLAVKPQVMADVVPAYAQWNGGTTTFLSVAAGTSIASLVGHLGAEVPMIRCMPNTPAAIGKGMMVCCANARTPAEMRDLASDLLAASGNVRWIDDEGLMDAVTAVSGSGPAYIFHFIECLASAAREAGLPDDVGSELAMQTVYGAACLAKESGEDPGVLRQQVTSPNGTTAAALARLMGDDRLARLVADAVDAAKQRSIELGKG